MATVNVGLMHYDVTLPIYTRSESNARGHWATKSPRTAEHRGLARQMVRAAAGFLSILGPGVRLTVTLTRIRPIHRQALDDDNCRGALKACRDGVADALGVKDNDPRVAWEYEQATAKDYAVRVVISGSTSSPRAKTRREVR
jgi:crossover junction endodeoxyribonuclease RusA